MKHYRSHGLMFMGFYAIGLLTRSVSDVFILIVIGCTVGVISSMLGRHFEVP